MPIAQKAIEVVERAYDVDAPIDSWLESIRRTAERAFGDHMASQAYTFAVSRRGAFELQSIASDPVHEAALRNCHIRAQPSVIRQMYLRGPVTNSDQVLSGHKTTPDIWSISVTTSTSRARLGLIRAAMAVPLPS
jgi:hypothetical protein